MTLKETWELLQLTPTQVAAQAGISVPTLYKMNRKERVSSRIVARVCEVLCISVEEYKNMQEDRGVKQHARSE